MFKGKTVIVTGAAQGIGEGIAMSFSQNGANVIICDIQEKIIEKAKSISSETGNPVLGYRCDVTNSQDVEMVVRESIKHFGRIDVLVNNAAILRLRPFIECSETEFQAHWDVNVKGYFLFAQAVCRHMIGHGGGKIINMSSCAAKKAVDDHFSYCTAKAAITGLTRMIALEMGPYGISCNAVCPGITDTEMVRSSYLTTPEVEKEWADKNVYKRLGKVEDQAKAVMMLAGDLADYITGESIIVSGGEIMGQ